MFQSLSLGAFVVLATLSCGAADGDAATSTELEVSVELVDFDGLDAAIEERRGEGTLLNFWAIWCSPCVAELPELLEVGQEWTERGGMVLGISYDLMTPGKEPRATVAEVEEFLERRRFDFPVLVYDAPDFDAINEHFDLPGGVPVTLAINAKGEIVDREDGPADKARFEEMMRKALGRS